MPCRRRRIYEGAFWLGSPVVLGLLLGSLLPTNTQCPAMPEPLDRISSIIGWVGAALGANQPGGGRASKCAALTPA